MNRQRQIVNVTETNTMADEMLEPVVALEEAMPEDFTPPKKGWKTSQFAVTAFGTLVLGVLTWKGIITADQARDFGEQIGVTGIFATALASITWFLKTYVDGRNRVAAVRQQGFNNIKHAQAVGTAQVATAAAGGMPFGADPSQLAMGFNWGKFGKKLGKVAAGVAINTIPGAGAAVQVAQIAEAIGIPGADRVNSVIEATQNVIDDPHDPNNERAAQMQAMTIDELIRQNQQLNARVARLEQMVGLR